MKDELEEVLNISVSTPYLLQHEKIGPRITEAYKKSGLENSSTHGYIIFLLGYARSQFRDFKSHLRFEIGLNADNIQLILKQYSSNFVTYELSPGIYTIEDISETVYTMGDHEVTIQSEYVDTRMKTKPILTPFGGTFGTLRFNEKIF